MGAIDWCQRHAATPLVLALIACVAASRAGAQRSRASGPGATPSGRPPSAVGVGPGVHVSTDRSADPFFETALAIDPRDTRHLIGAAIEFRRDGTKGSAIYVSWDGGESWTRGRRVGTDSTLFSGMDPVVLFGPGGIPYFVHGDDRIHVHRSRDGGRTWERGITVAGGNYDRQWVAVDRSGRYRGRMYLVGLQNVQRVDGTRAGVIAVSISTDSGRSFEEPERVTDVDDESVMAMGLAVARDGTVLIPYKAGPNSPGTTVDSASLHLMRSTDGGRTFQRLGRIATISWPANERPRAFAVSPLASMASDGTSGPFAGRLYLAWSDYGPVGTGDRSAFHIKVARSEDGGRSWVVANATDDTSAADETTQAIAVNGSGVIGVTWYDRRGDPTNRCHRLFFAASFDGGATFGPNVPVGEAQPTCPTSTANWIPRAFTYSDTDRPMSPDGKPVDVVGFFSPTGRFQNAGDTQGLVADSAGQFHALWIGSERDGVAQLFSTTLRVDTAVARAGPGREVTGDVRFDVSGSTIDTERKEVRVSVRVVNGAHASLRGPLVLTLVTLESRLEGLRATNADNDATGVGARWSIPLASDSTLTPRGRSGAVILRFRYDRGSPSQTRSVEPLRLAFRLTARSDSTESSTESSHP